MFSLIKKIFFFLIGIILIFSTNYGLRGKIFAENKDQFLDSSELKIIELTNYQRSKHDLGALNTNKKLQQAAEAKALDMIENNYFDHVSPTGLSPWYFIREANYTYQSAGENLAIDFNNQENAVAAWLKSPTHRANILDSDYTEIGLAIVVGEVKGFQTTVVVQIFGQPLESGLFAKHFTTGL